MQKTPFKKTAIIGASGFIGRYFHRFYQTFFPDCFGSTRNEIDLRSPNIQSLQLGKNKYQAAIILAAISDINQCETFPAETRAVNVTGTLELIRQLVSEGILPIFISSDYVFDGNEGNYSEDSKPKPTTEYGKQKLEVESNLPLVAAQEYLIVRFGKILSLSLKDKTLVREFFQKLNSGHSFFAAYDQIFSPTIITDLVSVVNLAHSKGLRGIIHASSTEVWSRYDLAVQFARSINADTRKIVRVSLEDVRLTPKRPKNTSLKSVRVQKELGFQFQNIVEFLGKSQENTKT